MEPIVNSDPHGKIALQGYDPVAFQTAGTAAKGSPSISARVGGFKYLFASEDNKTAFEEESQEYLPVYGGYCAYGVSLGMLFPVEIATWEIIDGRLVLQFSQEVKRKFNEDSAGNLRKADESWPKIEEEKRA